jgi:hypothetical protein
LNFIFGIVCLFVCVCAFSLRRESPDMILGDKPLIFEVVLSQLPRVMTAKPGVTGVLQMVSEPTLMVSRESTCQLRRI